MIEVVYRSLPSRPYKIRAEASMGLARYHPKMGAGRDCCVIEVVYRSLPSRPYKIRAEASMGLARYHPKRWGNGQD